MLKNDNLRLIAMESIDGLGEMVDRHLQDMRDTRNSFIVPLDEVRFQNGEGKVKINDSIRGKDVYILSDVENYSITYPMYDFINHKSPDDHFQDIKRVIYAIRDHSYNNSVIMPMLYEGRQHKRKGRESLDCACALQELRNLSVRNILTFDVHDIGTQNAIPISSYESLPVSREMTLELLKEDIDFNNMFVISPDNGAIGRCNLYANLFQCDLGFFRKERDLEKVENGKAKITTHVYVGQDCNNKNVIISDDMISSGESMIDCCKTAKNMGAKNIYIMVTFALFTDGIEMFDRAYKEGIFTKLFVTNLSYIPEVYKNKEYVQIVDCSKKLAGAINALNCGESISPLLNDSEYTRNQVKQKQLIKKY